MANAITKDFRVCLTVEQWEEIIRLKRLGVHKNQVAYAGIACALENEELKAHMLKEAAERKAAAAAEQKEYQREYAERRRDKKKKAAASAMDID